MGSDTQEVRDLLATLTTKIKASNAILDTQAIGKCPLWPAKHGRQYPRRPCFIGRINN